MKRAWFKASVASVVAMAALAGCSSSPPAPDWQMNAKGALERSVAAWLEGNSRVELAEFTRARSEAASTGQVDVVARVELTRCAARTAALVFDACEGFGKLSADASPAERAYADYIAGKSTPQGIALLPPQHRAVAVVLAGSGDVGAAQVQAIEDPLARLVASGAAFRASKAAPDLVKTAVDTASAQGWRRPLLAWLGVQARLAEKAGDAEGAARARRRIALVEGG
ncbi:hypothetical protein ACO2Q9_19280 [Variovorax sp. VNK109]|uniref:hypothetical protein n=1 Tax=Variovorax sp. VNK109 TaxID=3400919 RepID=UPI003C117960